MNLFIREFSNECVYNDIQHGLLQRAQFERSIESNSSISFFETPYQRNCPLIVRY